jgi:hypothetical protein
MIRRFLYLYKVINNSITISEKIKYKNRLRFTDDELKYIKDCLDIFTIFVKASTKLQAEIYPTIQYIYPYIYQIRIKLEEKFNDESLVSFLILI